MSHAVIAFGRFNPPTEAGHGKLVSAVQSHAEKVGGQHYIFPTRSQDKKKNPLSHDDKVGIMKKLFPKTNIVSHKGVNTLIDAMKHLESKGHTHVTMVAGSDRVEEFHKLLNSYREKEFPKIKKINVVSAGNRDPDSEGAEGMSASKLRGLVASGKKKEFISHYSDPKLGAEIHDKIKVGMQMESIRPVGIFLLGGPGSGKDYVLNNIFSRFDLMEVQAEQIINGSAKELYESVENDRKNIVINGATDAESIRIIEQILGEDYSFDYVCVSVNNTVSRLRNESRKQPISENKRLEKWSKAEKLAREMQDQCFRFNNSINLNESTQFEQIMFASQIEKLLERLIGHGLVMKEAKKIKSFSSLRENKYPTEKEMDKSRARAQKRKAYLHHHNFHAKQIAKPQVNEMQLAGTDSYRIHAISMTPGQNQEIEDVTKTMGIDTGVYNNPPTKKPCGCEESCACGSSADAGSGSKNTKLAQRILSAKRKIRESAKEKAESTVEINPTLKPQRRKGQITPPTSRHSSLDGLPVLTGPGGIFKSV